MSKVVHLTEDAHRRAKDFCNENDLKMSDWVAMLIEEAIAAGTTKPQLRADGGVRGLAPKKKILERLEAKQAIPQEEHVPVYAQPPFWARRMAK